MGSSQSIHVGPYARIMRKDVPDTTIRYTCNNADCNKLYVSKDTQYCPLCGGKIQQDVVPIMKRSQIVDIIYRQEFEDEVYFVHNGGTELSEEFEYLIPNTIVPGEVLVVEHRAGVYPVSVELVQPQIDWMKNEYVDLFAAIVEEYGEDALSFHWGVVVHYN